MRHASVEKTTETNLQWSKELRLRQIKQEKYSTEPWFTEHDYLLVQLINTCDKKNSDCHSIEPCPCFQLPTRESIYAYKCTLQGAGYESIRFFLEKHLISVHILYTTRLGTHLHGES